MKNRNLTLSLCAAFALIIALAFAPSAGADLYMKEKMHTDAFEMMGNKQPEKNETVTIWMAKDRGRSDMGGEATSIIRMDQDKIYLLNNTEKTYVEMPVGAMADMAAGAMEGSGMTPEEKAKAQQMMKGMMAQMQATVTDTGEKKEVNGYQCTLYKLQMKLPMGTSTSDIWATQDIKIDPALYQALSNAMMAKMPGYDNLLNEMKKIKGIPVLTTTTTTVMQTPVKATQELLEAKEKAAPAGTYDIPEGYKKTKGF
jgi:hypothetical protein